MNLVDPRSSTNAPRLQSAPLPAPAQHSSAPRIPPEDRTGTSTRCQRQQANRGGASSPRWRLQLNATPPSFRKIAALLLLNFFKSHEYHTHCIPNWRCCASRAELLRANLLIGRFRALYRNPEKQVRLQPSASGGVPEPTAPSRVSGRAASAWHWARSSSHPRREWAANAV